MDIKQELIKTALEARSKKELKGTVQESLESIDLFEKLLSEIQKQGYDWADMAGGPDNTYCSMLWISDEDRLAYERTTAGASADTPEEAAAHALLWILEEGE